MTDLYIQHLFDLIKSVYTINIFRMSGPGHQQPVQSIASAPPAYAPSSGEAPTPAYAPAEADGNQ